jgi:hypothetical protein
MGVGFMAAAAAALLGAIIVALRLPDRRGGVAPAPVAS